MPDTGEAVDDLVSMRPHSSNVCYPLKMETTASDGFRLHDKELHQQPALHRLGDLGTLIAYP